MYGSRREREDTEIEREVKEFGNGAHVTLPGEYIGETVVIAPVTDEDTPLQPPITKDKIRTVLANATRDGFTRQTRSKDNYPREQEFQYDGDIRLSIEVELAYETDSMWITELEMGRVIHNLFDPDEAELREHTTWWDDFTDSPDWYQPENLLCIDPAAANILDHGDPGYGDIYQYTVQWNGSAVTSARFGTRPGAQGDYYLPFWENYDSLTDYQESLAYHIATAISDAPVDAYDQYLELLTDRGLRWGGEDNDPTQTHDLDHEELLAETTICRP